MIYTVMLGVKVSLAIGKTLAADLSCVQVKSLDSPISLAIGKTLAADLSCVQVR